MKKESVPTELDLARAAGLFDGEGCISLGKHGHNYQLVLRVSMTNRAAITDLHRILGGTTITAPARGASHKPVHIWSLRGWPIARVLLNLYPHLITKQAEAAVALNYLLWRQAHHNRYTPSMARTAAAYWRMLKEMKQA